MGKFYECFSNYEEYQQLYNYSELCGVMIEILESADCPNERKERLKKHQSIAYDKCKKISDERAKEHKKKKNNKARKNHEKNMRIKHKGINK